MFLANQENGQYRSDFFSSKLFHKTKDNYQRKPDFEHKNM